MHVLKRLLWFCGGAALAAMLLAALGPVRLTVALGPVPAVDAAPPADLPTGTPPMIPPTSAPTVVIAGPSLTPAASAAPTATTPPATPAASTGDPTASPTPAASTGDPTASPTTPATPAASTSDPTASPTTPPKATRQPRQPAASPTPAASTGDPTWSPTVPPQPTPADPGQPQLTLQKRADRASAQAGQRVIFTLTARNDGAAPAADVVITDAVPPAFAVVDLRSSKGDVVVSGQTVTAYPVTLAPGEQVEVSITTDVRAGFAGAVQNSATITSSTPGDDPGDNTGLTTITLDAPPVQRLPVTAAPPQPSGFLAIYWPLLVLALGGVVFGGLLRAGLLRPALVQVTLGGRTTNASQLLTLDADELVARWRRGATIAQIGAAAAQANPHADPLVVAQAVQQLISAAVRTEGARCDR